jgi:mannose-6-phosphate isomerase-like protein (cupin superfamily)
VGGFRPRPAFRATDANCLCDLDSRLFDIADYQRAIRSEVPPLQAATLAELSARIGLPARNLETTIEAFNAAATGDASQFDATRCDGLATAAGLEPRKSNWARPITRPPFLAWPLIGAVAYTFGGLATNEGAEVLGKTLVMPETANSRHIDYRISLYQPMAHVARHKHVVQEQIYHVLEGEGLMEIAGQTRVVRRHDFIFLPPGVEHAISNSGMVDLVFLVITSPVADGAKPI